jgi:hypothetical protein
MRALRSIFVLGVLTAIALNNLWQMRDPALEGDIAVITKDLVIEENLSHYKGLLGKDYQGYRNHIYRVFSFSLHFLHGDETYRDVIAAALVYHDIALWTDGTNAYIKPSRARARKDLKDKNFDPEQRSLIEGIIEWHHKVTPYRGEHADVINAVRKADWADFTYGIAHFGLPRKHIATVRDAIPEAGFHKTLTEFALGKRVHKWNIPKAVWEVLHIYRW